MSVELRGATVVAPKRYALVVEYSGAGFRGWQKQDHDGLPTIQAALESALSRIANHSVSVVCAGRTDSGVNATWQVVHFDSSANRDERAWVLGTNTHLPNSIAVKSAHQVSDSFHARFAAQSRRYRYLILSSAVKPAILHSGVTWTHKKLDVEIMHQAGQFLVGEHDFTSYRAVGCQAKSPVRKIEFLSVKQHGSLIILDVQANAFLHHMIRNIAGVLMKIGSKEAGPNWSKEVLDAKDRRKGGVTAPPFGLYFIDVKYPSEFGLPSSSLGPYFL